MADVLAVVKRTVFDYHDRHRGPLGPGSGPLEWTDYESKHWLLDEYLDNGDRIFLVTARPGGLLWLIAVYEDVERRKGGWCARRDNRTAIIDISDLRGKLKFHTGKGITTDDSKLGNSLQTPRRLTRADIQLIEKALKQKGQTIGAARTVLGEEEAEALEGQRVRFEAERYKRYPQLVRARLKKDGYRCVHCSFGVSKKFFPKELRSMSRIVHVHHVRPLMDGKRKSKLNDLITLCPTCHAVVHAVAASTGQALVGLNLLRKYYSP